MNQVDDIILKGPAPRKEKKKGKGILVIIFLLFIILAGLCGAYWYFTNYMQETPKTAFFKYVGQNNFSNIFNTDIYYKMLDKMNTQSFETTTTANLTTTIDNDLTNSIDVSKLDLNLDIVSDKKNDDALIDAKITYSSNDLFNVKLISTKDSIGIGSTEILDKYVATSKTEFANSIRRTTGEETDISADIADETVDNLSKNKVDLEEEYKKQKVTEYTNLVLGKIPEEAVTENENVVVTINSQTINTKAYTLSLNSAQYKEVITNVLTTLENDSELLNKIVTGTEKEAVEATDENTINPIMNVQVDYEGGQTENLQTAAEINVEEAEDDGLQMVQDIQDDNLVKENLEVVEPVQDETLVKEETDLEKVKDVPDDTLVKDGTDLYTNLISALVFNQKIEGTVENLIDDISAELTKVSETNEGVKITVYVRNEEEMPKETIKLVVDLPNKINVDIEYQAENKVKITYLADVKVDEKTVTEGTSIEIERISTDMTTKIIAEIETIENKKVIEKTKIELETEGTEASNKYTNEAIVTVTDSEGEFKTNIKNVINFKNVSMAETLTDENAIFIDKITDEEAANLYTQIMDKIVQVYAEKIINLAFIDNNSSASVIEQPEVQENAEEKAQIRQSLIQTVSTMMGEAQSNGETFTIQNLTDLKMEGHNVSCIVTEDIATIKVDGYTFTIDNNFVLSE